MHEIGFQIRFMAEEGFTSKFHILAALAFAPPNGVTDLVDTLADCSENIYEQNLNDMLHYI